MQITRTKLLIILFLLFFLFGCTTEKVEYPELDDTPDFIIVDKSRIHLFKEGESSPERFQTIQRTDGNQIFIPWLQCKNGNTLFALTSRNPDLSDNLAMIDGEHCVIRSEKAPNMNAYAANDQYFFYASAYAKSTDILRYDYELNQNLKITLDVEENTLCMPAAMQVIGDRLYYLYTVLPLPAESMTQIDNYLMIMDTDLNVLEKIRIDTVYDHFRDMAAVGDLLYLVEPAGMDESGIETAQNIIRVFDTKTNQLTDEVIYTSVMSPYAIRYDSLHNSLIIHHDHYAFSKHVFTIYNLTDRTETIIDTSQWIPDQINVSRGTCDVSQDNYYFLIENHLLTFDLNSETYIVSDLSSEFHMDTPHTILTVDHSQ